MFREGFKKQKNISFWGCEVSAVPLQGENLGREGGLEEPFLGKVPYMKNVCGLESRAAMSLSRLRIKIGIYPHLSIMQKLLRYAQVNGQIITVKMLYFYIS